MTQHIKQVIGALAIFATFSPTAYALDAFTGSPYLSDYASLSYSSNFACVKEGSTCYYCGSASSCGSLGCASTVNVAIGKYQAIGTSGSAIGCLGNIFCMAPRNTLIVPENVNTDEGHVIYNYLPQDGRHCYVNAQPTMCGTWVMTPEMIDGRPYCKCKSVPNYLINDAPCSACEKDYYKTASETEKCTHCPSFGNIAAQTTGVYNPVGIIACHLPEGSMGSDDTGTFILTESCFYKQ